MEGSPPSYRPRQGLGASSQKEPPKVTDAQRLGLASQFDPRNGGQRDLDSSEPNPSSSDEFHAYVERTAEARAVWKATNPEVFATLVTAETRTAEVSNEWRSRGGLNREVLRMMLQDAGVFLAPEADLDDWSICPSPMALVKGYGGRPHMRKLRVL